VIGIRECDRGYAAILQASLEMIGIICKPDAIGHFALNIDGFSNIDDSISNTVPGQHDIRQHEHAKFADRDRRRGHRRPDPRHRLATPWPVGGGLRTGA
jgi:hypothetical protein